MNPNHEGKSDFIINQKRCGVTRKMNPNHEEKITLRILQLTSEVRVTCKMNPKTD